MPQNYDPKHRIDGDALKAFRLLQGLSQSSLGRIAGVTQANISRIENSWSNPSHTVGPRSTGNSFHQAVVLSRALGIPIESLVGELDEDPWAPTLEKARIRDAQAREERENKDNKKSLDTQSTPIHSPSQTTRHGDVQ